GAVALGEHVEDGREFHVHAETPQLERLDLALAVSERLFARGPHREVVGEDRRAAAQHDDPPALVVRRDEEPPTERRLEGAEETPELVSALEVAAVENEAAGARLAEEAHVLVAEGGPGQANHQLLADEVLEIGHVAIVCRLRSRAVNPLTSTNSVGARAYAR